MIDIDGLGEISGRDRVWIANSAVSSVSPVQSKSNPIFLPYTLVSITGLIMDRYRHVNRPKSLA